MNNILKFRSGICKYGFANLSKQFRLGFYNRNQIISAHSTAMLHMCSSSRDDKFLKVKSALQFRQCECSGLLHTKTEKNLTEFLRTEIGEERKSQRITSLPKDLNGFIIENDEAELNFKKKNDFETITISMNVNHSVDTDENGPGDSYASEIKSKPSFEIDIIRGKSTLSFTCSFVSFSEARNEKADVFQIDEVTLFKGEWSEKNYVVAGEILDENLYDLFMSLLFEMGITNEFMEQVSEIATYYEHSKYIDLLEDIRNFSLIN